MMLGEEKDIRNELVDKYSTGTDKTSTHHRHIVVLFYHIKIITVAVLISR